jgi:ABC-2 type transport system ATP-binding protein
MLQLENINRSFGAHHVLKDVSFTVQPGRLTGFVGSNGAGKTTTMRIALGVLSADSGTVLIDGRPVGGEDRRRFGYMPEERGLYPKMRVAEQLVYLARLHGLTAAAARRNTDRLLERLDLSERAADDVQTLSLGNQQRAQIAAALVHDPEILVLDEPFSGLDPIAVEVVLGVLKERADAGNPVLFSSHQLDIVERLCDDLVIIADGAIRTAGPTERLRREYALPRYEILLAGDAGWLRQVEGIELLEVDRDRAVFETESDASAQRILRLALERGDVAAFGRQQPSLASIFREVIR